MKLFEDNFYNKYFNKKYESYGKLKEYKVLVCSIKDIRPFVEYWHYSKNVNGLTYDYCFKLLDKKQNLIGAIIYGKIGMANVWKKYADKESDLIELKRLCCIDKTPKNTESYFIGNTLRWLKKNTNFKKVISYADMTYNHNGTIYKATNFNHNGITLDGKIILYKNKVYHDKTIRTKHNGQLKPFAKEIINALNTGKAIYKNTKGKHIYTYELSK